MNPSLCVNLDSLKTDPALLPGARGARKLAVTKICNCTEKKARSQQWAPPKAGERAPVLQMHAVEMAVFNQNADQQRHYHRQGTEIYVVVEGEMAIDVGSACHHLKPGGTVIIPPGVVHAVKKKGLKFIAYVINANCGGPGDKFPVE